MLLELEASILDRLQAALKPHPVYLRAFPESPNELGRPTPRGQILLGYKRSSFRKTGEFPLQLEMLAEFEISLQLNNLRTHTGAYPLLDLIRSTLVGFVPLAGMDRPMYPVSEAFTDLDEGTWIYTLNFVAPLVIPGEYEPIAPDNWNPDSIRVQAGIWRSLAESLPDKDESRLDRLFDLVPEQEL